MPKITLELPEELSTQVAQIGITTDEKLELDEYERIEHCVVMLKAGI